MKYLDYVNLNYKPSKDDLICLFRVEPANGISMKEAAGAIAAESSIGTWTETTTTKPYVEKLVAKVFEMNGNFIKVAYPSELFEPGNLPNILSSIAGNIFGMKHLKNLRLVDIDFPEKILKRFKGPKYGIDGVRKILKVKDRPLIGTIIKPKIGLKTEDHAKVAYEAWVGGCDIVKDDENLSSQKFNKFEERLEKTFKMKEKAERETGEKKVYMINVTAETEEMLRRANLVEKIGNEYIMVDVITIGWSSLQTLRDKNFDLVIHGHRAGHAAMTKNPNHGISVKVLAKLVRIVGIDQFHVGTAVGKMFEGREEVLENCKALKEKMWKFKPVMPVASGGLSPIHVPKIVEIFGKDVVIQAGGGIHGHKLGTKAGAMAMRQALDAVMKEIHLEEYALSHKELKIALEELK
ncbi:MAG: type III ribulose-bisphosphate carboxylase [Candidatus Aenigmatarchaeota archaeon]